jgi:hypothetical protein
MIGLTDVLKSPSVWTGKDGVAGVADLLKNPPLQDKIQFGLMKSSFDTLVKTGEIVTPGTDLKAPTGLLYNAAANAGKSLISPSAGLVELPRELSSIASGSLSSLTSGLSGALGGVTGALGGLAGSVTGALGGLAGGATGALTGALGSVTGALGGLAGGATGALSSITSNLGSVSALADNGTAQLGGLLANASKYGVGTAVEWAKTTSGATGALSRTLSGATATLSGGASGIANVLSGGAAGALAGASGALSGALGGAAGALTGAASKLTSGLTSKMDSLAKQGEFAVNFSDTKLPSAVAGIVPAAGFKGTIDRSTLNAATAKLIGSDKIALPDFSPQAVDTSALTDAASKAKGLLSGGLDAGGLLSKATGALGGLGGLGALGGLAAGALGGLGGVGSLGGLGGLAGSLSGALGAASGLGALASSTDSITRERVGLNPDPGAARFADASKALKLQDEYEELIAKVGRADPRAQALLAEIRALLANATV